MRKAAQLQLKRIIDFSGFGLIIFVVMWLMVSHWSAIVFGAVYGWLNLVLELWCWHESRRLDGE